MQRIHAARATVLLAVLLLVSQGLARSNASPTSLAYVSFCINVHDFVNVQESADTLLRLIDLFERYEARGDFYLTAQIVQRYLEERPDIIERLIRSDMTISYHIRPPHPAYKGFDRLLADLDPASLVTTLSAYEIYATDLATGELLDARAGGMTLFWETFGAPPSVATIPFETYRSTLLPIWFEMGAQMTVTYHESGTDLEHPYEWRDGLLIRPSDFSITRWPIEPGGESQFWWNMIDTEVARIFEPTNYFKRRIDEWSQDRSPFVTVLIHESNFYRQGATPWTYLFYTDGKKTIPRQPPYDLSAPDASKPRSSEQQEAIWEAYETLIAHASSSHHVVTSVDIVEMAAARQSD